MVTVFTLKSVQTDHMETPTLAAAFGDDTPETLGCLLWEAAGVDAAILTAGVVIGVLIGRWLHHQGWTLR